MTYNPNIESIDAKLTRRAQLLHVIDATAGCLLTADVARPAKFQITATCNKQAKSERHELGRDHGKYLSCPIDKTKEKGGERLHTFAFSPHRPCPGESPVTYSSFDSSLVV
ncbi:hypothetical protein PoB_003983600 [Plakobranchus ocellatus]|uniref:Uncharacterized protein n=1 Tax=Plakobranchus ocellatus TaxID=259542 RepID=A0AAV4AQA3_9GAST|nr:hypothetical protein PoB_003983600 [Plakobranchus ocellatus]